MQLSSVMWNGGSFFSLEGTWPWACLLGHSLLPPLPPKQNKKERKSLSFSGHERIEHAPNYVSWNLIEFPYDRWGRLCVCYHYSVLWSKTISRWTEAFHPRMLILLGFTTLPIWLWISRYNSLSRLLQRTLYSQEELRGFCCSLTFSLSMLLSTPKLLGVKWREQSSNQTRAPPVAVLPFTDRPGRGAVFSECQVQHSCTRGSTVETGGACTMITSVPSFQNLRSKSSSPESLLSYCKGTREGGCACICLHSLSRSSW